MVFSNVATLVGAGASVAVISEAYKGSLAMGFVNTSTFIVAVIIIGFLAGRIKKLGEKYGISTIVEYFGIRFDKKNKTIMTIFQLILLIAWIGLQIMAVTVLVSELLNVSYFIALGIVAVVCLSYSMIGGIKADFILDFIQFWVMLAVFLIMGIVAYQHTDLLTMLRDTPSDVLNPFAYKGVAWAIMGMLMMTTAYISSSPYWQKIFSAKSVEVAKKSFFYAAPLVLILTCCILFLGLYAYHNVSGLDNADKATFVLISELLPWGAGIGFAAIIATVTSSLDSMFVAGSTIIYREFVSEKEKSITKARMITLGFGLLSIFVTLLFTQVIDL
jgi:SSS family solute:Na+ symporter